MTLEEIQAMDNTRLGCELTNLLRLPYSINESEDICISPKRAKEVEEIVRNKVGVQKLWWAGHKVHGGVDYKDEYDMTWKEYEIGLNASIASPRSIAEACALVLQQS